MAAPPLDPSEPPTELQMVQFKMNATTDESLEATRRMLAMADEAKEAGISTLVMLDDQGEQLDRIDEGMAKINQDMKDAKKNLDDLNKCCGLCVLPWNKVKSNKMNKDAWKNEGDGAAGADGPRIVIDQNGMGVQGGYITKVTNDAREDEMDQNLTEVSGMIGNLRNMAIDMGSTINQHITQIDIIQQKAINNQADIEIANAQASKIMKKA